MASVTSCWETTEGIVDISHSGVNLNINSFLLKLFFKKMLKFSLKKKNRVRGKLNFFFFFTKVLLQVRVNTQDISDFNRVG